MLGRRAEADRRGPGLSQWHQTGRQKRTSEVAVMGAQLRIPGVGATHCRHAADGDVVLDECRHPVEVPAVRPPRATARPGPVERLVGHPVQRGVHRFGTGDGGVDDVVRGHRACPQGFHHADGIEVAEGIVTEGGYAIHDPDGTKAYRPVSAGHDQHTRPPRPESQGPRVSTFDYAWTVRPGRPRSGRTASRSHRPRRAAP